jgi:hypothetical protein
MTWHGGLTSIIPCLALRGVASAIARSRSLRAKVLFCKPRRRATAAVSRSQRSLTRRPNNNKFALVNSKNDRETEGYTAADHIQSALTPIFVSCLLSRCELTLSLNEPGRSRAR